MCCIVTDQPRPLRGRLSSWIAAVALFLLAAFAFTRFGAQGELLRDDAIFLYSGQQMVEGIAPYLSIFDHKGPLAPMLCALGVFGARLLGADDIVGARAVYFLLSCGAVVGMYFLALSLMRSRMAALLSAVLFMALERFAFQAVAGPRPKSAGVLFEILSLWCITRQRWFTAALLGTLAGLTWQPMGIFALAAVALAWLHTNEHGARSHATLRALSGVALPVAVCALYFASQGALLPMLDGMFLFNVLYLTDAVSFPERLIAIGRSIYFDFRGMGMCIALGFAAMAGWYAWRARANGTGLRGALTRDRFAGVLITFPFPILWSMVDFQSYPDFFVFLPYVTLGFAWLLHAGLEEVGRKLGFEDGARIPVCAGVAAVLACAFFAHGHIHPAGNLARQRSDAALLEQRFGEDARTVSIGVPQAMVLLGRRNPTSYGFLVRGVDQHLAANTLGGFEGWLAGLAATSPDLVLVDRQVDHRIAREHAELLGEWLAGYEECTDLEMAWRVFASDTSPTILSPVWGARRSEVASIPDVQ